VKGCRIEILETSATKTNDFSYLSSVPPEHSTVVNVTVSPTVILRTVHFATQYIYAWGPRLHSGYGAVLQIGRSLARSQLVSVDFPLT
jgi:hypothetical protein